MQFENMLETEGTMKGQAEYGINVGKLLIGLGIGIGVALLIGPTFITQGLSQAGLTGLNLTIGNLVLTLFLVLIIMIIVGSM